MKRILSFLLALTMIISALAVLSSCGNNKNPEEPTYRATVSEQEWIANMKQTNYTLDGKYLGTDNYLTEHRVEHFYGKIDIAINSKGYKFYQEITSGGSAEIYSFLQIIKDGKYYNVYKNAYNGQFEALELCEDEISDWHTVSDVVYALNVDIRLADVYNNFTFNPEEKCYTYSFTSPNNITIKAFFADGVITAIKLETDWEDEGYYGTIVYDLVYTNVGSTVVDVPNYNVVEN